MDTKEKDEIGRATAELEEYAYLVSSQENVPLFSGMILQGIIERLQKFTE